MDKKIMVIDDQPGVRRLICEALKQVGYNLCMAAEGSEGLAKIPNEKPDLIVLDIKMPGMSGMEFLKELRKRSYSTPVIIITAYSELELEESASKFSSYILPKPFDIKQMYRLVQAALAPEYSGFQAAGQI